VARARQRRHARAGTQTLCQAPGNHGSTLPPWRRRARALPSLRLELGARGPEPLYSSSATWKLEPPNPNALTGRPTWLGTPLDPGTRARIRRRGSSRCRAWDPGASLDRRRKHTL
jgi:hypothetical protein